MSNPSVSIQCESCSTDYNFALPNFVVRNPQKPMAFRCSVCGYRFNVDPKELLVQPSVGASFVLVDKNGTWQVHRTLEEVQNAVADDEIPADAYVRVFGEEWEKIESSSHFLSNREETEALVEEIIEDFIPENEIEDEESSEQFVTEEAQSTAPAPEEISASDLEKLISVFDEDDTDDEERSEAIDDFSSEQQDWSALDPFSEEQKVEEEPQPKGLSAPEEAPVRKGLSAPELSSPEEDAPQRKGLSSPGLSASGLLSPEEVPVRKGLSSPESSAPAEEAPVRKGLSAPEGEAPQRKGLSSPEISAPDFDDTPQSIKIQPEEEDLALSDIDDPDKEKRELDEYLEFREEEENKSKNSDELSGEVWADFEDDASDGSEEAMAEEFSESDGTSKGSKYPADEDTHLKEVGDVSFEGFGYDEESEEEADKTFERLSFFENEEDKKPKKEINPLYVLAAIVLFAIGSLAYAYIANIKENANLKGLQTNSDRLTEATEDKEALLEASGRNEEDDSIDSVEEQLATTNMGTYLNPTMLPDSEGEDLSIETNDTVEDISRRAWEAYNTGNADMAIRLFKVVLERDPNNVYGVSGLGSSYEMRGQNDLAISQYCQVVNIPSIDSEDLEFWLGHAEQLGSFCN